MSIKIHHGPPGSYKTSGAVMDDFIPAARAGRTIVTNVRGLSSVDRVCDALGDVPPEFDLIYLPTAEHPDSAKNRDYLAKWFHWMPVPAPGGHRRTRPSAATSHRQHRTPRCSCTTPPAGHR
jgi:zona occludens toxin